MADPLLLPAGTRLVHIGPHKTGTTAVQHAFHGNREALAAHGVQYAGRTIQPYRPVVALTGQPGRLGAPPVGEDDWQRFVHEVDAAGDRRVVISSESLAGADVAAIRRLVRDLGPDRVHVVRMLRRYDKLIPSQWQQSVAAGMVRPYARWLGGVVAHPDDPFWQRHGYAELTRRWVDVLGPEHVSVVVMDERDRAYLLRVFERLLGLPVGTLPTPDATHNRSLTRNESELLRAFNRQLRRRHWDEEAHHRYIRLGATPALKEQARDPRDVAVSLTSEALDVAAAAAERGIADVRRLGVRVIGDLDDLRVPPGERPHPPQEDPVLVSARAVGVATAGAVEGIVAAPPFSLIRDPHDKPEWVRRLPMERRPPEFVPASAIAAMLGARLRRKLLPSRTRRR